MVIVILGGILLLVLIAAVATWREVDEWYAWGKPIMANPETLQTLAMLNELQEWNREMLARSFRIPSDRIRPA